jgi:hypothetical protein
MGYHELPTPPAQPRGLLNRTRISLSGLGLLAIAWICFTSSFRHRNTEPDIARVQQCSIDNLHADLSFLDEAKPIAPAEFLERRDRLARALHADGIDAFVLEPGYTFQCVYL